MRRKENDVCKSDTDHADRDGKQWFARAMWDSLPDDAKERLRESRKESAEKDQ